MTYAADETGIQTSQPREAIDIVFPLKTYQFATGDQSIVVGGVTYTPASGQRGEIAIMGDGSANSMEISVSVLHPAVQRYMSAGIPPMQAIGVKIQRLQLTSVQSIQIWNGLWTSLTVDRHIARIKCSSRVGFALQRRLPTVSAGRECPHALYNAGCLVTRTSFQVPTTVLTRDGSTITVASMSGKPDQWAQFGELLHVASGEKMTIGSQIGTTIQMQCRIAEMADNDAVIVYAGCAKDVTTCRDKFANVVNFGGQPALKPNRAWAPGDRGTISINNPRRQLF